MTDSWFAAHEADRVVLMDYDEGWPIIFGAESALILEAVGSAAVAIEHIGSTSIPGLAAKPIIDLLLGVGRLEDIDPWVSALTQLGYQRLVEAESMFSHQRFFDKGPTWPKTSHLHVAEVGTSDWTEPITFRDWLRAHPADRDAYAQLKHQLAASVPRFTYLANKAPFIQSILAKSAVERGNGEGLP